MTLLIKNVHIIGGEGIMPDPADVFITGDKISAIGSFPNKKADVIVDAQGAQLTPGFIDLNTDSDHFLSIFDDPGQEDFLQQGVTTILGGMCGSSLAPLLYGGLESIQKWTSIQATNVSWHRVEEFLLMLSKKPLGVNFGTLVGHSTIRRSLVGEAIRNLSKSELSVFGETLGRGIREGAMGFSTGLSYVHSRLTPYSEIKSLAQITKSYNGLYATHLRNISEGISESVGETIKLAKETKVRTLISHFIPIIGAEREYEEALAMIDALPKSLDFHFDIYPHHTTVRPLYTFLPQWSQNGGHEVMVKNIDEEWLLQKILKDLPEIKPDDFIVANVPSDYSLAGKSLKDLMKLYGIKNSKEALIKLMKTTGLRATILYKEVNHDLMKKALKSKRALIASNAASFKPSDPRKMFKAKGTFNTFMEFLNLATKEHLMTFEEAIRKITLEPAKKLGLEGRGIIKEGYIADLAGIKEGEVKFTIVNGVLAYKGGEFQGWFPGRVLRHRIPTA